MLLILCIFVVVIDNIMFITRWSFKFFLTLDSFRSVLIRKDCDIDGYDKGKPKLDEKIKSLDYRFLRLKCPHHTNLVSKNIETKAIKILCTRPFPVYIFDTCRKKKA